MSFVNDYLIACKAKPILVGFLIYYAMVCIDWNRIYLHVNTYGGHPSLGPTVRGCYTTELHVWVTQLY